MKKLFLLLCVASTSLFGSQYYYPPQFHRVSSLAIDGSSLELEDGSIWRIAPEHRHEIAEWLPNDPLAISPNMSFFQSGKYLITNKSRGVYVEASLHLGPI